jgi:hypothetical protein
MNALNGTILVTEQTTEILAVLGGESRSCTNETMWKVGEELMARHPGLGIPEFRRQGQAMTPAQAGQPVLTSTERDVKRPTPIPPSAPKVEPGRHDVIGEARSTTDREAAVAAGFAPARPLYRAGTRVLDLGVENARAKRIAWEERPLVREYCQGFVQQVAREERRDLKVYGGKLRMDREGRLLVPGARVQVTREAIGPLVTRLGIGGGAYLRDSCWPSLRAMNVNQQCLALQTRETAARTQDPTYAPMQLKLRTRNGAAGREMFAAVGPSYTAFDVDRIAQALALAAPNDVRGTVTYDGVKARFTVTWHSTVQPEHYVAGEFFQAGVIITTDDTGGGSIRIRAFVEQNLCLNLIILDTATQEIVSIRHVGSVEKLADRFREGFKDALQRIEFFRAEWGYAVERDELAAVRGSESDSIPLSVALPGLFNGLIEHDLVPISGSRKDAVKALVQAWNVDTSAARVGRPEDSISRASLVNAVTRYAHENEQPSPWHEDALEAAAGKLLAQGKNGFGKNAIPFVPIDLS